MWDKVNSAKPLWMRPPKEVTKDEYDEFYKTTFKAYDTPDAYTHFSLEGQVEFRAMLFLPSTVPWELSQDMFNEKVASLKLEPSRHLATPHSQTPKLPRSPHPHTPTLLHSHHPTIPQSHSPTVPQSHNSSPKAHHISPCLQVTSVKLFVKRVFISESFEEQLLPRWLSFLKGVVDSDDLPLNVSREILQKSRVLSIISKRLVRKSLDMFKEIAKDEEKFATFTKNFGRYIKVGLIEDKDNKDALLSLASFASSDDSVPERGTTIPEYKARMKEGQKQIYYVSGASKAAASSSPVLDRLKSQGFEVLFALDQIDEIALQGVGTFEELEVIDAAKENVDLGEQSDAEKQAESAAKEDFKEVCEYLKETLGMQVDKCEVSARLTKAPCALVQPQWGVSPQMQRFMRAQAPLTSMSTAAVLSLAFACARNLIMDSKPIPDPHPNPYATPTPTPHPIPNPSPNPNRPTLTRLPRRARTRWTWAWHPTWRSTRSTLLSSSSRAWSRRTARRPPPRTSPRSCLTWPP